MFAIGNLVRKSGAVAFGVVLGAGMVLSAGISLGALQDPGGAMRVSGDRSNTVKSAIVEGTPTYVDNVILMIGDGMGDSEITIARNYAYGAGGLLPGLDSLTFTGTYTTYSLQKNGLPDYATDSAASATGFATGVKTFDGAIGIDIKGTVQQSLLAKAKAAGKRTGNVTTDTIYGATPASQVAHVANRKCAGPATAASSCANTTQNAPAGKSDLLDKGGPGSISEQLVQTKPDVVIGGGNDVFEKQKVKAGAWSGQLMKNYAMGVGYNYQTSWSGLYAAPGTPVMGLLSSSTMPTRFADTASKAVKGGAKKSAISCTLNSTTRPTLKDLTQKAVSLLSGGSGFFLQVEGALIDKRAHAHDVCGQIGETLDFDEAVQYALEFAKSNGRTLVIVTADHGHASQIVDSSPPGLSVKVRTLEGADMIVSYGTASGTQQHTGTQVRIGAYGPGAANVVGVIDQTDVHNIIARALGLTTVTTPSMSLVTPTVTGASSGGPKVGDTLRATGEPTGLAVSYQWKRNGVDIPLATTLAYKVTIDDAGAYLTVSAKAGSATTSSTAQLVQKGTATMTAKLADSTISTKTAPKVTVSLAVKNAPSPASGQVTINWGLSSYTHTLIPGDKGKFSYTMPKLPKGKYTVSVTYSGSSQVTGASKSLSLKVS
ncbi:MAG: alkaline phosphatase [Propionibacteriaceae bacterium]|jgi:alkaline phosphatase|nr:alkaline phosphatase [Propionibacteriaceae bacterium]